MIAQLLEFGVRLYKITWVRIEKKMVFQRHVGVLMVGQMRNGCWGGGTNEEWILPLDTDCRCPGQ